MSKKEDAFYAYKLKADSGYESDSRGRISVARHGVVCAALSGALSDDIALLKAAPELLEALEWALPVAIAAQDAHRLERIKAGHSDICGTYKDGTTYSGIYQDEVDRIEAAHAAIAKARGN